MCATRLARVSACFVSRSREGFGVDAIVFLISDALDTGPDTK
jgi:hypothetical protein